MAICRLVFDWWTNLPFTTGRIQSKSIAVTAAHPRLHAEESKSYPPFIEIMRGSIGGFIEATASLFSAVRNSNIQS